MRHSCTSGLRVHSVLVDFIEGQAAPGTGIEPELFWKSLEKVLRAFTPRNEELLQKRTELQNALTHWYQTHKNPHFNATEYKKFLYDIGYLLPEKAPFTIGTRGVDPELSTLAGPQLVVPATNPRYALNAANARWGSLYDALYGSDVLPETEQTQRTAEYNPHRGRMVVEMAMDFLNSFLPLTCGRHQEVQSYTLRQANGKTFLEIETAKGRSFLQDDTAFVGFHQKNILFCHHGLHIELCIDPKHPIGALSPAGVYDVLLESALSTIVDFEDSVATVDGCDKTDAYRVWLGLLRGTLSARFQKKGQEILRTLHPDRRYQSPEGALFTLPGRSLLLLRTVGLLMKTDAVLLDEEPVFEGILDTMVAALTGMHDLKGLGRYRNSRTGSMYVVKPKMHGPEEVSFTCELFNRVESELKLPRYSIKIGIMDEERRTSANLTECIRPAKNRIIFINTGFLDRTGDEIHTNMYAGPLLPRAAMKQSPWIQAYELRNVQKGLQCGFAQKAQIGKGMWAMPDKMRAMLDSKGEHPRSGANCAWVPSPVAATLHALHYHQTDVFARQQELLHAPCPSLEELLTLPLLTTALSATEKCAELENSCQSILGYVVRWVQQGIGCSKVPDISGVGLMEDRATLRISSQYLANWLLHGLCTEEEVEETLARMAQVVDAQNAEDTEYTPMAPDFENSLVFQAARALIFEGLQAPSGYTEPLLHHFRKLAKS